MKIFFGFFNPFFLCVLDKGYNSVEAAVIAVKDFNITPQIAAEKMSAPLDKVLESLANTHL